MANFFFSGGPVMYPLLFCSVLVLFVVLERIIFWTAIDMQRDRDLLDEVLELCRQGKWNDVREKVRGSRDFVIRIIVSGIVHRDYSMSKAMESAATEQLQSMGRFMGVLDTMITVAPLLGILGTVIGIIDSFEILGAAGIDDPRTVTGGIAQALITTAAGLGIAIFSVFPYNYFRSRLRRSAYVIEQYATSLEIVYEKLDQNIVVQEQTG